MLITQITSPLQFSMVLYHLKVEFFYRKWKLSLFWENFWRISFICIWIKSCSWYYCVLREMVLCQRLSWCSGLHRLAYITCWQNRRRCLCVYQKILHIDPYGQFFDVSCILWDKCGEGFALKQLYRIYYWCLQTTRQIKDSRVYNKIEWNFVINFIIWPCIHSWRS